MTDTFERLAAGTGNRRGDLAAVVVAEQAIDVAVDDQRRQVDLAEPLVSVVSGAGLHLLQHNRLGRRQRRTHLGEGGEARILGAEVGGEVDLPHRPEDLFGHTGGVGRAEHLQVLRSHQRALRTAAVAGADGKGADSLRVVKRQLLGDHPAHRDADDVSGVQLQRVEQTGAVGGEVGDRERQLGLTRVPHAAIVEDDHLEAALELVEEGTPPGEVGRAHPLDQQQWLTLAGAQVVQFGARCIDARHASDPTPSWRARA